MYWEKRVGEIFSDIIAIKAASCIFYLAIDDTSALLQPLFYSLVKINNILLFNV